MAKPADIPTVSEEEMPAAHQAEFRRIIFDGARKSGSRYVMKYNLLAAGTGEPITNGYLPITPGLSLNEIFGNALLHEDLVDRTLIIQAITDVSEGGEVPVEGFPRVLQGPVTHPDRLHLN